MLEYKVLYAPDTTTLQNELNEFAQTGGQLQEFTTCIDPKDDTPKFVAVMVREVPDPAP